MYSAGVASTFLDAGFPIRRSMDRRPQTAPHGLSQFCHVLLRLLVPRHPPNALTSLTTKPFRPPSSPGGKLAGTLRQTVKSIIFVRLAALRRRVSPPGARISQTHCCRTGGSSRRAGRPGRLMRISTSLPYVSLCSGTTAPDAERRLMRASRFVQLFIFQPSSGP